MNRPRNWTSFGSGEGGGSSRGFSISPSTRRSLIAAAVIFGLLIIVFGSASFWVNWWWYGSMDHRSVLVTRYSAQIIAFITGALIGGGFFLANLIFALRRSRGSREGSDLPVIAERLIVFAVLAASAFIGFTSGSTIAANWETWMLFLNGESFGVNDPVYDMDVGFYFFTLPALRLAHAALIPLLIVTTLAVVGVYVLRLGIDPRRYRDVPDLIKGHLFALIGALLFVFAGGYLLANYNLVYSDRGVVVGSSYTDINFQRFANFALAAITALIAVLVIAGARRFRLRALLIAGAAWIVTQLLLGVMVPGIVQRIVVDPNQLRRETPSIANNIDMTRSAFGLTEMEERSLSGQAQLTAAELESQPEALNNLRLWDYRFARETYQQRQSLEPFYVFSDVDVDRYTIDGEQRQVLISARELDVNGLPDPAQTWTNRHLAYTHGYGAVVSPVSEADSAGLPRYLVGNIPPTGSGVLAIDRPEIYYGELRGEWVVVNTNVSEFSGSGTATEDYVGDGAGSIQLNNFFSRLITSMYLGDRNVLISGEITDESRVMIRRQIIDRAVEVAPFLVYDPDPYLVIADGQLFWIIDAYTISSSWPHASRARGINYMRNSVKVVVDAYNGTTTFYRTAEPDPIADAYGRIFDGLLQPIEDVPPAIAEHFRYPELLFEIQSEILTQHHVTDPRTFFDGNDVWRIPPGGTEGNEPLEPYFVTIALPGEETVEFTLIRPFIPGGRQTRQNMAAWLAGQAGPDGRTRLVSYRFPRETAIFGPQQIEARISQDTEIAPQITLLSQGGSQVIRGNLLVIPLEESMLYVQPLYVRATGSQGAYPELGKVIVASSERVVMRDTLDEALEALVQTTAPPVIEEDAPPPPPDLVADAPTEDLLVDPELLSSAQQALDAYERAQAALAQGDWTTYGEELARMETYLRDLAAEAEALDLSEATPNPDE